MQTNLSVDVSIARMPITSASIATEPTTEPAPKPAETDTFESTQRGPQQYNVKRGESFEQTDEASGAELRFKLKAHQLERHPDKVMDRIERRVDRYLDQTGADEGVRVAVGDAVVAFGSRIESWNAGESIGADVAVDAAPTDIVSPDVQADTELAPVAPADELDETSSADDPSASVDIRDLFSDFMDALRTAFTPTVAEAPAAVIEPVEAYPTGPYTADEVGPEDVYLFQRIDVTI